MPTILQSEGFRFFFFSNEGHEPPHVHIEAGDHYAKFWLSPVVLARSVGFNSAELNHLRRMVEGNRDFFKEKWDEYFRG
jgi:hypothetical protein